jgi:hypothetical protein
MDGQEHEKIAGQEIFRGKSAQPHQTPVHHPQRTEL